jgi:hypothetical protein
MNKSWVKNTRQMLPVSIIVSEIFRENDNFSLQHLPPSKTILNERVLFFVCRRGFNDKSRVVIMNEWKRLPYLYFYFFFFPFERIMQWPYNWGFVKECCN